MSSTETSNQPVVHVRHQPLPLTPRRILIHIVKVGIRMAFFRLIFGFVKQLFMKGAIFKGFKKISVGIETEVISYNPLKWAAFGMSLSMYRPVQFVLESAFKKISPSSPSQKQNKNDQPQTEQTGEDHHTDLSAAKLFSVAIAGILVSLPINKIFNKNSRIELMLYVVVRAVHAFISGYLYPSNMLPAICYKMSPEFWNISALTVISSVLLGNSTFNPETHSKEYANFLVQATVKSTQQMQSVANHHYGTWSPAVADHCYRNGITSVLNAVKTNPITGIKTVSPGSEYCKILHPGFSSCTLANLDHIVRHFLSVSLPLYGPLKVVTALAKGPGPWVKNPVRAAKRLGISILQSCGFLTFYVCMSYRVVCLWNTMDARSWFFNCVAVGIVSALALKLEPIERQTDLVLFCAMHGLRSGVMLAHKLNYIPRPKMSTVVVAHSVAWSALFLIHEMRPHTLRGIFASMMKMFIGDRKVTHNETIQPHPHQHHVVDNNKDTATTKTTLVVAEEEIVVVETQ